MQPVVTIDRRLLDKSEAIARAHLPNETGGALLGFWVRPQEAWVAEVTCSGPRAIATATTFVPDGDYIDQVLRSRWTEGHGLISYLGDWHSHPNSRSPRLSYRDRRTIRLVARQMPERRLLHLLVGLDGDSFIPVVWLCRRRWIVPSRLVTS